MPEKINKLSDVYGNSRNVPLTYQDRKGVDDRFVSDLTREKHIILHGGSKQGKTTLRKNVLREDEYIVVQCTRDTTRLKLYEMILKNADVKYEVSSSKSVSGNFKLSVNVEAEAKVPLFVKGTAGADANYENEKGTETHFKRIEIDADDVNDIVRVLNEVKFKKYIIIEDFHYLDEEVQRSFAFDLKVILETSGLVFIIVGVWQESNRLTIYNGDLGGRITNINVDKWEDADLKKVIENGEPLLNIQFPDTVKDTIIKISQDNVGLLQETCYRLCEEYDVMRTQEEYKSIGTEQDVLKIVKEIADDQASRYRTFMVKFSEGLSTTTTEMYKWIMYAVIHLNPQELKNGVQPARIFNLIRAVHPKKDTLQQASLLSALERVQTVQFKHKLQPLILDYSNGNLFVVDANFLVYLTTHDKEELLNVIGIKAC